MTDILHITLYGTEHCHLCEQASDILHQVAAEIPCKIQHIDITTNDTLFAQYQTSIPVLHITEFKQSLNWSFNLADVIRLISRHRL